MPVAAIPNPGDLFNPGVWIEKSVQAFFGLLVKGTMALLGGMLKMFGHVSEPDFTRAWVTDAYGRVLLVVAALGVMLLILSAAGSVARRGPAGALEPLGRLGAVFLWIGMVRALIGIMLSFSDALTVYLAPNVERDIEGMMAAMVQWTGAIPPNGVIVWLGMTFAGLLATFIMAIQLFIRKYAIVILYMVAPFAGIFSVAQARMPLVRKCTVLLLAAIFSKPLMALCVSLIAAPLAAGGGATIEEGFASVAGLGVAAFAPWVLLAAVYSTVAGSIAHASASGNPVAGANKAVTTATARGDTVKTIRQRLDNHTNTAQGNKAAWNRNRPLVGAAAAAGMAAVAPAVAAKGASAGRATVAQPVVALSAAGRNGGPPAQSLLVADKAGRVVDVGRPVQGEPAGLSVNDRHAYRDEHVNRNDPTPVQPPPPRRAPEVERKNQ